MTKRNVKSTLERDDGEPLNGFNLRGGMVRFHLERSIPVAVQRTDEWGQRGFGETCQEVGMVRR